MSALDASRKAVGGPREEVQGCHPEQARGQSRGRVVRGSDGGDLMPEEV